MKWNLRKKVKAAVNNQRGITLVEVLAVLVLTIMVTGLLTYVLNFANTSLQQVSAREEVLQESRDIIQHITASVRESGFAPAGMEPAGAAPRYLPAAQASAPVTRLHLVNRDHTESIDYNWNSEERTLTVERKVNEQTTLLHTFSEHVIDLGFKAEQQHLRGPIRYTVALEIELPNETSRRTMTTILSSDR